MNYTIEKINLIETEVSYDDLKHFIKEERISISKVLADVLK